MFRFLVNLIDKYGIDNFPKVLIVGNKLLRDTDFETLMKHEVFDGKIYFLS